MQHGRFTRRSSQQLSRPSSCNFARGVSHTPLEEDDRTPSPITSPIAYPLPNERASPKTQEQPEEEHHEATEGDASTPTPCVQGSDAGLGGLSNVPQGKILIGIESNAVRDFVPRKCAFAKMTEIVHGHFNGPWTSISKVPDTVKNMWFEEFEKSFCWTFTNDAMKRVFVFPAGLHLRNTFKVYRKNGTTPFFVKEDLWQSMERLRRTDVNMVKQAEVNKQNRSSKRAIDSGAYRGGSRKVSKWMLEMEKKKGYKPMISEVIRDLWSKPDGTGMGALPASCVAEFDRLVADNPTSEPISRLKETELWIQACNGPHNGRIFGLGEEGIALVRSGMVDNLKGIPSPSIIHTQEYMEPLKDEVREMRAELKEMQAQNKALKDMMQAQNKALKDMMQRLLELQGGTGTSTPRDSSPTP